MLNAQKKPRYISNALGRCCWPQKMRRMRRVKRVGIEKAETSGVLYQIGTSCDASSRITKTVRGSIEFRLQRGKRLTVYL